MKLRVLKYLCALCVLTSASSCMNNMGMSDSVTFVVNASEDVRSLFTVRISYTNAYGDVTTRILQDEEWVFSVYKSKDFDAKMNITLSARAGAKNGSLLTKEVYEMSVEAKINSVKTKAGEDEEEILPFIGAYTKDMMPRYIALYDGAVLALSE